MKKILKNVIMIFIIAMLISPVFAMDTDFKTNEVPQREWNETWNSFRFRKADDLNTIKGAIKTFDVSEDGEILLCLENNSILILDNEGKRLKAFKYNSTGSSLACWKGENILLFFWRGYLMVEITTDGKLVGMQEIDHSDVNNSDMLRKWQSTRQIESNECTYRAENDGLIADLLSGNTHSKLIKTDADGNSKMLYGSSNTQTSKIVAVVFILLLVWVIAPLAVIIFMIRFYNKRKKTS